MIKCDNRLDLFERPMDDINIALANEFYLIKEKNFFEVFKQVKEILNMTTEYPQMMALMVQKDLEMLALMNENNSD